MALPLSTASSAEAPLAVIAAMPEELAPLVRLARVDGTSSLGSLRVRRASIAGGELRLAVSGVGARRAEDAAAALLAGCRPAALLVIGVAGGLQPGLPCGALVVAERLRDAGPTLPAPDPRLVERAVRAGATRGTVLSAPRMLCTAADKARGRADAATAGPAVVDLESAAFARQAARAAIPFVVVRAVCDPAEEDLPLDFNAFRDEQGGVRRSAVGRRALFRPDLLPRLLDLRRRVGRCSESLARFTERFLSGETA